MSWGIAGHSERKQIIECLRSHEWQAVNLMNRLLHQKDERGVFLADRGTKGFQQVVFLSPAGLLLPFLPLAGEMGPADIKELRDFLLAQKRPLRSAVGLTRYVDFLKDHLKLLPTTTITYNLMVKDEESASPALIDCPDLIIRRAGLGDLDSLLPLQEAYEKEEVLIDQAYFDKRKTRLELKAALSFQTVYMGILCGKAVTKGATNAKGIGWDQIGGVFTLPEYRGKHFARILVRELTHDIRSSNKSACLFVKKQNTAARQLYNNLGFRIAEDFTISYFYG